MNKKHELALRKSLLVMRASLERAELVEQIDAICHPQPRSWWHSLWRRSLQAALPALLRGKGASLAIALLRKLPALVSASSFLVHKTKHPLLLQGLRWAGISVAVWQLVKWWRAAR